MKKKVQAKTRQGYKGSGGNPKKERRVISKKKVYSPQTKTKKHIGTREVIQQQENGLWQDLNRQTVKNLAKKHNTDEPKN